MEPADYIAIAQLLARYCHIVDNKEWDRLTEVFAEDASMSVPGRYETHVGTAALRVLYSEKMNHPVAHNSTSLIVLDDHGDRTRVASKWVTVRADGASGSGVYTDDLVRTPEGWRIQARVARAAG
jgi:SnoaL-like domain